MPPQRVPAREDDGAPSWRPEVFEAIAKETRARCPVILNFSTGGAGPMSERHAHLTLGKPEIAALNMGSMNYSKYSSKRKAFRAGRNR